MPEPSPQRIAAVRRFNRFYTRQIGVLRKTYLDSPYSLGEMRVLYEISRGTVIGDGPTASDIARALDLDAGYLSRVLRNFEKRGLIARKTSAKDARQSHLTLSAKGRKTFAPIERRSRGSRRQHARQAQARRTDATGECHGNDRNPARRRRRRRRRSAATFCAHRSTAISAGWSARTPNSTPRNTIGPSRSKACARRSSPTSSTISIRSASAAGSPRWTARTSAASCW